MNKLDKNINLPKDAKCVFEGKLFSTYQWEQELFNGEKTIFEKIVRIPSTQLICIDENKNIILSKQSQPGKADFLSLIGGMVERGEIPEENAKKELLEECGMITDNIKLWKIQNYGGKIEWPTYYYICKNCKKVQEQKLDGGEKIEVFKTNFEEFIKTILDDNFRNQNFKLLILKMIYNNEIEEFKKLLLN